MRAYLAALSLGILVAASGALAQTTAGPDVVVLHAARGGSNFA